MNTTERQQSLADARRMRDWLGYYVSGQYKEIILADHMRELMAALVAEFSRLDAKEQKQIAAGAKGKEFGILGAQHGSKGGWKKGKPRKSTGGKK
jgi:hypothetical protein